MATFKIRAPIWNNGRHEVGLNAKRVTDGHNRIEVTYKSKGELIYPDAFRADSKQIRAGKVQWTKGVKLYVISISDLELDKPKEYKFREVILSDGSKAVERYT